MSGAHDASSDTEMQRLLPPVRKMVASVTFRLPKRRDPVAFPDWLSELSRRNCVIFGERHHQPHVLKAQLAALAGLAGRLSDDEQRSEQRVTVVLEMVNFEQQRYLDRFMTDENYTLTDLQTDYDLSGKESFDLEGHYGILLQLARELGCTLRAGFLPKQDARLAMSDVEALKQRVGESYPHFDLDKYFISQPGSDKHYAYFEAMINGASRRPRTEDAVAGTMKRIFAAQIVKDASMACAIDRALRESGDPANAKVLAICGNGHSDYGYGVPERLDAGGLLPDGKPFIITSRSTAELNGEEWDEEMADALYVYESILDGE